MNFKLALSLLLVGLLVITCEAQSRRAGGRRGGGRGRGRVSGPEKACMDFLMMKPTREMRRTMRTMRGEVKIMMEGLSNSTINDLLDMGYPGDVTMKKLMDGVKMSAKVVAMGLVDIDTATVNTTVIMDELNNKITDDTDPMIDVVESIPDCESESLAATDPLAVAFVFGNCVMEICLEVQNEVITTLDA